MRTCIVTQYTQPYVIGNESYQIIIYPSRVIWKNQRPFWRLATTMPKRCWARNSHLWFVGLSTKCRDGLRPMVFKRFDAQSQYTSWRVYTTKHDRVKSCSLPVQCTVSKLTYNSLCHRSVNLWTLQPIHQQDWAGLWIEESPALQRRIWWSHDSTSLTNLIGETNASQDTRPIDSPRGNKS